LFVERTTFERDAAFVQKLCTQVAINQEKMSLEAGTGFAVWCIDVLVKNFMQQYSVAST